jgi:acyl carrier protein
MSNETFERLRELLARELGLDPSTLRTHTPLEQLGIDSLGTTGLLFAIEDTFGIRVPPEPLSLATVGDLVESIDRLAGGGLQTGRTGAPDAPRG